MVHRCHLLDQWRERLSSFLQISQDAIGTIGGGKNKPNGCLDVGVIQSLNRKGSVSDVVAGYGQVIVNECPIIGVVSFEQVLRKAQARFVFGRTATPTRKDGHQPIITMHCGPVRFRVDARNRDARLDTLLLTLPISWRGTLQQYAGRLRYFDCIHCAPAALDNCGYCGIIYVGQYR